MRKILIQFLAIVSCLPALTLASEGVGLVAKMTSLQYFTHKTALSIDAENKQLTGFYLHELEETLEELEEINSYHGKPIGKLVKTILHPAFEKLEDEAKGRDWDATSKALDNLINSCNECHDSTGYRFLKIKRTSENPYFQSFE